MSIKHDYGRLLTFIVLLIVSSSTAIAQELMKVTGLVVDQNAEPLIGVTVKVKDDAKSGTVTGLDGDFSIMVQKGKTLVFSYLGYKTKEVPAITSKLKINMKEDNKMLDDVVVVGYGVQKKSSVTGAISQVRKRISRIVPSLMPRLPCKVKQQVYRSSHHHLPQVPLQPFVFAVTLPTFLPTHST